MVHALKRISTPYFSLNCQIDSQCLGLWKMFGSVQLMFSLDLDPVQTWNFLCAESNHLIWHMRSSTFESIKFDEFDLGRPNY